MNIYFIKELLDQYFKIEHFFPDQPFSTIFPETYKKLNINKYIYPDFLITFHGMMIQNSNNVDKIFTTVFLGDEILNEVFNRLERDVLIISHHPLHMETSGRGFLPISKNFFKKMKKFGVSIYVIHTPLDAHNDISTWRAMSNKLELSIIKKYCSEAIGFSCVCGLYKHMILFEELLLKISEITGVKDLHFIKKKKMIKKIALVPGGSDIEDIIATNELDCDVLLTGTYYNQVKNLFGEKQRKDFNDIKDNLNISLIECSHYGFESLVMKEDLIKFCINRFKIDCEFISQNNPWY